MIKLTDIVSSLIGFNNFMESTQIYLIVSAY